MAESSLPMSSFDDLLETAIQRYLNCSQEHSPLPCYRRSDDEECLLISMVTRWQEVVKLTPETVDPRVAALAMAGCNHLRARMVLSDEGFGMQDISSVVTAFRSNQHNETLTLAGFGFCQQCKPGTNTFARTSQSYSGSCHRVFINLSRFSHSLENVHGVLCIGKGGKLKVCGPGEFMAVSHVWEHGWQGTTEDGLCSRVLSMLLDIASQFGIEWVWLDIAMICQDPRIRAMSVNAMNLVYRTAKVTAVCDRILLSMKGGSDREKALALAASDWCTRVWTMQEGLLSTNITIVQNDSMWSAEKLFQSLIYANDQPDQWKAYGAIRSLFPLVSILTSDTETILERALISCRERETTKRVDLARAFYPLFDLKWPGPDTTLEQGQIRLLEHLGPQASRCTGLFGPIGLPSPWSWAPLTLAGSSGGLTSLGRLVTADGLVGAWSWKEVQAIRHENVAEKNGRIAQGGGWKRLLADTKRAFEHGTKANLSKLRSTTELVTSILNDIQRGVWVNRNVSWTGANGHPATMANLTGGIVDMIEFCDVRSQARFLTMVHYRETEPYPWPACRLFLLASVNRPNRREGGYYDLVVVRSCDSGWYEMHRVGAVFGFWMDMADGDLAIQGIIS